MKDLRPYQQEAVDLLLQADRGGCIWDEPGLGKTLMGITIAADTDLPTGPRLVLCTNSSKEQWHEEIRDQFPQAPVYILGAAGRPPADPGFSWRLVAEGYPIWIIVHHEALIYEKANLPRIEWSSIIVDEAHRFKNRKAKRTGRLKLLKVKPGGKRIALTATPQEKSPADLWSILNWIRPREYSSYWRFFNRYVDAVDGFFGGKEIRGPRTENLPELAERLSPFTIQRTKQEVAPDLPPRIMQRIPLQIEDQQKALYGKISTSRDIEVDLAEEDGTPNVMVIKNTLAKIIRLQQVTSHPILLQHDAPSVKFEWVRDWVKDNPHTPAVIFARFRDTVINLAGALKPLTPSKEVSVLIGGSDRTGLAEWKRGRTHLLIGTIGSMGQALNLQRASTAIFVDQDWSTINMTQAVDRIHRINIDEPKLIIYLYARKTVDELILKALDNKWNDAKVVLEYLRSYQ